MMGRTTLREVREALAAARSSEPLPPAATAVAELELLAKALQGEARDEAGTGPPIDSPVPEPNQALQPTGGA